jgi:hypothetical protein
VFFVIYVDLGDYTLYNSRILGADHLAIVENGGVANPPIFCTAHDSFLPKKLLRQSCVLGKPRWRGYDGR